MNLTDEQTWQFSGLEDKAVGNTTPAMSREDFYRDFDPEDAERFFNAYMKGWNYDQGRD